MRKHVCENIFFRSQNPISRPHTKGKHVLRSERIEECPGFCSKKNVRRIPGVSWILMQGFRSTRAGSIFCPTWSNGLPQSPGHEQIVGSNPGQGDFFCSFLTPGGLLACSASLPGVGILGNTPPLHFSSFY